MPQRVALRCQRKTISEMNPALFGLVSGSAPLIASSPFNPLQAPYSFGAIDLVSAEQALLICSTARIASSREA